MANEHNKLRQTRIKETMSHGEDTQRSIFMEQEKKATENIKRRPKTLGASHDEKGQNIHTKEKGKSIPRNEDRLLKENERGVGRRTDSSDYDGDISDDNPDDDSHDDIEDDFDDDFDDIDGNVLRSLRGPRRRRELWRSNFRPISPAREKTDRQTLEKTEQEERDAQEKMGRKKRDDEAEETPEVKNSELENFLAAFPLKKRKREGEEEARRREFARSETDEEMADE